MSKIVYLKLAEDVTLMQSEVPLGIMKVFLMWG